MSETTQQIADMLDMLPSEEQQFALEVMKKLVLAWDPDFTKLTADEARRLDASDKEDGVPLDAIDWT